ncbi:DNA cytosine methyltransferase [Achromobacter spanius]|uniref:DNA cytosine methyltransferase n=2 Tax=Achromobacter spanius TaxID=217203 RepID=UPI003AF13079
MLMYAAGQSQPTVGSLFAGIGGFDIGFERAGFRTAWQVEINPIARAVLADRFPHAKQFEDVCAVGADQLDRVDVVVGGFPCQRKLPLQVDTAR